MAIIGGDHDQLRWRQVAVGVTTAVVFLASVVVLAVRSSSDEDDSRDEAVGSAMTTTTTPPSPTASTVPGDVAAAPVGDAPGSASTPSGAPTRMGTGASASAPAPLPGPPGSAPRLRVVSTRLDFGSDSTSQPLHLTNDGGTPLSWTASTSSPVLSVVPASGTLPPGATTQASVRLDRLAGPEGRLTGSVRITSDGGDGTVEVTGSVARPPAISG